MKLKLFAVSASLAALIAGAAVAAPAPTEIKVESGAPHRAVQDGVLSLDPTDAAQNLLIDFQADGAVAAKPGQ